MIGDFEQEKIMIVTANMNGVLALCQALCELRVLCWRFLARVLHQMRENKIGPMENQISPL